MWSLGIAVGAGIHGYVPEGFMASIMGKDAWWSVPLAVLIGIPMYSNAAGIIPVVQALLEKGAALGTVLAFMMSVIALSLPEMIILRKVLKVRLIATFAGVVGFGILVVGYLFNLLTRIGLVALEGLGEEQTGKNRDVAEHSGLRMTRNVAEQWFQSKKQKELKMDIKVLGPGCRRCHETEKVVREAVAEAGIQASVESHQ